MSPGVLLRRRRTDDLPARVVLHRRRDDAAGLPAWNVRRLDGPVIADVLRDVHLLHGQRHGRRVVLADAVRFSDSVAYAGAFAEPESARVTVADIVRQPGRDAVGHPHSVTLSQFLGHGHS